MDKLDITLLGPMRVTCAQGEDRTPISKRGRALVAMIALSERGERSRAWIQARLWSDRPTDQAAQSLRQELTKLRKQLGAGYISTELDRVMLNNVKVDVLDIFHAGAVASSFLAAEAPELLEGLEIRDEAFEEWIRLERVNWHARLEEIAGAVGSEIWQSPGHADDLSPPAPVTAPPAPSTPASTAVAAQPVPPYSRFAVPAAPRSVTAERPTLGVLPSLVRSNRAELAAIGEMTCDLLVKLVLENHTMDVFDFRDLSPDFADGPGGTGKPARGPDLLVSFRLTEVSGLIEIAVGVRRVENGRLIWTQSFSSDATDRELFTGERVAELVNQTVEAVETWLMRDMASDILCASRSILSAAHRIFCIAPTDLMAAETQLEQSFALDPTSVQLGWLAMLECVREGEGQDTPALKQERKERIDWLTAQALELDRNNSLALALLGHANAFIMRDYDFAGELISNAIHINPYRAVGWFSQAMLHMYTGDPEKGYKAALHGRSLGRNSPYAFWYNASCGIGAALTGNHSEALRYSKLALRQRPDFKASLRHLFASYAALGDVEAARETLAQLRALEPDFDPETIGSAPYPTPSAESIKLIKSGFDIATSNLESPSNTKILE